MTQWRAYNALPTAPKVNLAFVTESQHQIKPC